MGTANAGKAKPKPAAAEKAPKAPDSKEEATKLLLQGNKDLDAGNYLQALDEFQRAYAIFPSVKLHFNMAQTMLQLGRPLDALEHFELFLKGVKKEDAPDIWTIANNKVFELQGKIATLQLQSSVPDAEITVDGAAIGKTPLLQPARLQPGPHVIVVSKPGYEKQVIEVTFKPGEGITQRVKMLTEQEAVASRKAFQEEQAKRAAEEKARRDAEEKLARERTQSQQKRAQTKKSLRSAGFALLGVGLAAGVVGATFGGLSVVETNKVENAAAGTSWTDLSKHYDHASTYGLVGWIAGGAGAALVVTGAILAAVGRGGSEVVVAPLVAPGGGGVSFAGGF